MRAVVIAEHGGPAVLRVAEQPAPEPSTGQLLVDVAAAGVNYRDVYERAGIIPGLELPLVAGIEGAGTVAAVGDGVSGFAAGDRVCWWNAQGSYAEQALVPVEQAVPTPDGLTDEVAAAAILQGMTAHYLTTSTYPVQPGDTVLVQAAAGGVGLLLVQLVKRLGGRVIGTTSTPEKAEIVRAAGADEVIGYDGIAERVRELTDGEGVAVAYDGVGGATFDASLESLRRRGMVVVFGMASGPPAPLDLFRLFGPATYATMANLGAYTATRDELLRRAGDVFGWIAAGELDVRIGGRFSLDEAARAHEELEGRRSTGKLLLLPG
jgi:NADPH2:quinone reductase